MLPPPPDRRDRRALLATSRMAQDGDGAAGRNEGQPGREAAIPHAPRNPEHRRDLVMGDDRVLEAYYAKEEVDGGGHAWIR